MNDPIWNFKLYNAKCSENKTALLQLLCMKNPKGWQCNINADVGFCWVTSRCTGLVANPRNKLVLLLQITNPALDMCERQQKLRHVSELCNDVPSP